MPNTELNRNKQKQKYFYEISVIIRVEFSPVNQTEPTKPSTSKATRSHSHHQQYCSTNDPFVLSQAIHNLIYLIAQIARLVISM